MLLVRGHFCLFGILLLSLGSGGCRSEKVTFQFGPLWPLAALKEPVVAGKLRPAAFVPLASRFNAAQQAMR